MSIEMIQSHTEYNKLVRDFIPEIIKSQPSTISVKHREIQDNKEFIEALLDKLCEEANELRNAYYMNDEKSLEELADVQEVVNKILKEFGYTKTALVNSMHNKTIQKGAFDRRIFLETVDSRREYHGEYEDD